MKMYPVKGEHRNLTAVGWENSTLQADFRGGRSYLYGGVPESVKTKLLNSPYPDGLFAKIVRGKYVSKRVDTPPPARSRTTIDFDDLPF